MVGKYPATKTKNPGKSGTTAPDHPTPKAASAQSSPEAGDLGEKKKNRKKEIGQCLMATGSIVMIVGIIYITLNWFFHSGSPDLLWNQMLGLFQVLVGLVLLSVGFFMYMNFMDDGSIIKSMPNVPVPSIIPVKLSGEACQASWSQPDSFVNDVEAALPSYDAVNSANSAASAQPGYRESR